MLLFYSTVDKFTKHMNDAFRIKTIQLSCGAKELNGMRSDVTRPLLCVLLIIKMKIKTKMFKTISQFTQTASKTRKFIFMFLNI